MLKHTFVICAYGESPYLEECILSCKAQTSVNLGLSEILLYTSTPNEMIYSLVDKYGLNFRTKTGGSIGLDWNNALSFVETDYATIAHQDDIYLKDYGEIVISKFENNENNLLVFSDYNEIDEYSQLKKRNINLRIKTVGLNLLTIFQNKSYQHFIYGFGNFICCPAVSYNLNKIQEFKFNIKYKMVVDWDAWERIMKMQGEIGFIRQKLVLHRIHKDSETTNNTENHNREQEEFEMFSRYWGKKMSKLLMKLYVYNQKTNK